MNAAVFSVVNAVLLRPLAYPDAERPIWLAYHDPEWGDNLISRTDYVILERSGAFVREDGCLRQPGFGPRFRRPARRE